MNRSVVTIALATVLGFALLMPVGLLLMPSGPERVVEFADAIVVLKDTPCKVGAILSEVDADLRKQLKHGMVLFPKEAKLADRKLCWLEEDGMIGMVDETGERHVMPSEAFKAKPPGLAI